MAQLKEIMEIERQRTLPDDGNVIHLFQEGSFYRAYEWSAWLCVKPAFVRNGLYDGMVRGVVLRCIVGMTVWVRDVSSGDPAWVVVFYMCGDPRVMP